MAAMYRFRFDISPVCEYASDMSDKMARTGRKLEWVKFRQTLEQVLYMYSIHISRGLCVMNVTKVQQRS